MKEYKHSISYSVSEGSERYSTDSIECMEDDRMVGFNLYGIDLTVQISTQEDASHLINLLSNHKPYLPSKFHDEG